MTVETATKISQLNAVWPAGTDPKSEGDNHLRLVKSVLQACFDDSTAGVMKFPGNTLETTALNGGQLAGVRNLVINGSFRFNQRSYAGTALAAGAYGWDRWKADAGGATYSVSGGVATISAGTIVQVVEGLNVEVAGTYTLSWSGTASASVNGVSCANGAQVTLPAGTNVTLRFTGGTLSQVQLEPGTKATKYEQRQIQQELALCQRYFELQTMQLVNVAVGVALQGVPCRITYAVPKRATPAMTVTPQSGSGSLGSGTNTTISSTPNSFDFNANCASTNSLGSCTFIVKADAEL